MVLNKNELISALKGEVRILLHLASKVSPASLDYRPSAKQRTMLELLQYLTIMGPIHLRGVMADSWSMDGWRAAWNSGQATTKAMTLEEAIVAIGKQPELFAELLVPCSDADLRAEIHMFGYKANRGTMIVNLVLNHYVAYRMQLFLYLKACGHEELDTMNLWAGIDGAK